MNSLQLEMKYGDKFMYLIESTCKKNSTYITRAVFIYVLILFKTWTLFKVVSFRVEKTEVFKKG